MAAAGHGALPRRTRRRDCLYLLEHKTPKGWEITREIRSYRDDASTFSMFVTNFVAMDIGAGLRLTVGPVGNPEETNCMGCAEGYGRHAIDCPRNPEYDG